MKDAPVTNYEAPKLSGSDELQEVSNPALHASLDELNGRMRDLSRFFIQVDRLQKVKIHDFRADSYANNTVLKVQFNSVPIRGLYIENGTNSPNPIDFYAGESAQGPWPVSSVRSGTWRRIPVNEEIFMLSFTMPGGATGLLRLIVSARDYSPEMGNIV